MTKPGTRESTRLLAEFAAGLRYDDLPQRTREHCKNLILDALACALAGYQGEETDQVRGLASALAQGAFAAEKIEVRADAALSGSQAKVDLILDEGARLSAHCEHPLGAFENPLSRAQVDEKFRLCATGILSPARIDDVIDAVNRLEAFGSVRALMALLGAAPRSRAMAAAE